ncbi:hypothetical protein ACTMU2_25260 [Cupriavidus basilensis]
MRISCAHLRRSLAFYVALLAALAGARPARLVGSTARAGTAAAMATRASRHRAQARRAHARWTPCRGEMADLAGTLNAMLERLQSDFARLCPISPRSRA